MAIPSKQIGWGTQENLLWEISKQLEQLAGVMSKIGQTTSTTTTIVPITTTTTTTTIIPFSGTINFGNSGANACSESPSYNSFPVTGNGTTFCNSTELTSSSFSFQFPGEVGYISFGGQYYSILTDGTNTVTVTSSCAPCV
jgi:hypothetical protein